MNPCHLKDGRVKNMGEKILRGGLVGCGTVAAISHMPVWRAMKNVEIVGL
jgi:hypothetical protein